MILLDDKIIIVGAGCFGASTAYHLLKRGYTDVSILDRSSTLPAVDAASNDLNRIVRSSYADRFYAELAREAILLWKDEKEWGDAYHESPRSGVVVLGASDTEGRTYTDESYVNDVALGADVYTLDTNEAIHAVFPPGVRIASSINRTGYFNREGGWANAGQGLSILLSKVAALNGKIFPGKDVTKIIRHDGKTTGVECKDGTTFGAALVVIATGSWTPSAFPNLNLRNMCLATGQCIAMLQLSGEEADLYRNCPVFLDFSTGFYVFPPNENNIVKMAIHSAGYTSTVNDISTPRTVVSDPLQGLLIPTPSLRELRRLLKGVYPDLADKAFIGTRLCWYNDSPDGDWIIARHPNDSSLIIATAGSGHAYKFLPVIGRLVADLLEDALTPSTVKKFALDRIPLYMDTSRSGTITELNLVQLCTPDDLLR